MSNYTVTTNFAAKDSLPSGNPAKLILGAQLTTEFANIATAIATKLDSTTIVSSIAGTANQVAASASTGAVTLSLPQNVIIPAPASGVGLVANAVASGVAARFTDASTYGLDIQHSSVGTGPLINADASNVLRLGVGGTEFVTLSAAGAVAIAAVSSGSTLTIGSAQASTALSVLNGSSGSGFSTFADFSNGADANFDLIISQVGAASKFATIGPTVASALNLQTTNSTRVSISSAGAVTVAAPTSGTALTVQGLASNYASELFGNGGAGVNKGLHVVAGTNSADFLLVLTNAAQTANYLILDGAGSMYTSGQTPQGVGTLNAAGLFINGVAVTAGGGGTTGSFSAGTTGLTGATAACTYTKVGTAVTLFMAVPSTLVSSATGFTLTGLPAAIQPTTAKYATSPGLGLNNSAAANNVSALVSGSTITLGISGAAAAWTASGNKTVGDATHGAVFCWDTT